MPQKKRDGRLARVRATKEQYELMEDMRLFLVSHGYLVFTPSRQYRRHPLDFIAISKVTYGRLFFIVLVRVGANGSIELRPYERPNAHKALYSAIASGEFGEHVHWTTQLPNKKNKKQWRTYVHESQRFELEQLL